MRTRTVPIAEGKVGRDCENLYSGVSVNSGGQINVNNDQNDCKVIARLGRRGWTAVSSPVSYLLSF